MEGVPTSHKAELTRDVFAAWEAINSGVVDANTRARQKYWAHWKDYCNMFNTSPYLRQQTRLQQNILITAFAARVRTGAYGKGRRVKVQTVTKALGAVSKTIELAGERSPILETASTYTTPVARAVEGWRRNDPPAVPQLAVPVSVPNELYTSTRTGSQKAKAAGELALTAFYYLLRVGEYTRGCSTSSTSKRTVNFRVNDIGFFKEGKILPRTSPLSTLLTADACTLKIENQKNGRMGETIHHEKIGTALCPVQALAHRVHHILSNGGTGHHCICDYYNEKNQWRHVDAKYLLTQLRQTVIKLNLASTGIDPDLIGVHSLRAGGAMALKLHGIDDSTIMKIGRWTSMTFLMYIHNQIAHISKNLSTRMSRPLPFLNIAAIEPPIAQAA